MSALYYAGIIFVMRVYGYKIFSDIFAAYTTDTLTWWHSLYIICTIILEPSRSFQSAPSSLLKKPISTFTINNLLQHYMLNGNLNMVSRRTIETLVRKDPNQWLALKVIWALSGAFCNHCENSRKFVCSSNLQFWPEFEQRQCGLNWQGFIFRLSRIWVGLVVGGSRHSTVTTTHHAIWNNNVKCYYI